MVRSGADRAVTLLCRWSLALALAGATLPAGAGAAPVERELHIVATVDATQEWKKNDPKYPGDQWSKGATRQRYEITTRLRSDGNLEVRNLLDPNMQARLEAKSIHMARQAKKYLERTGQPPLKLPTTPEEKRAFILDFNERMFKCNGDPQCSSDLQVRSAAILSAVDHPEYLQDEGIPGRYLYFLPYDGCPQHSHVTLAISIEGVRYNKDSDKFVPFSERHSADAVDTSDGLSMCHHLLATIDSQDAAQPMYQETVFIPQPPGMTEYTENGHTSREEQPQPMPTAVLDWMTETLRHAPASGKASAELPLALPLNANATWLGRFSGTAKVTMEWSFAQVAAAK